MRVVHGDAVLASQVEVADSMLSRARGLMFRRSIPDDFALLFEFPRAARRSVHMLFVPFPIDAVWLIDDRVEAVKRLRPWIGLGSARADRLIEFPAGTAADLSPGDMVHLETTEDVRQ